jgi:quinol-cytochrome oxidoreductase complex cytochrome b subunit
VAGAYGSIKDIHFAVPGGRLMRNVHRWAAHGMVLAVLLHMARVFFTGSYRQPRQFNWMIGMALFALTLGLSFTGYLLPWDQLAFWATTIGAQIAGSPRELTDALGVTGLFDIGGLQQRLLLGADIVGEEALIRFYFLHCVFLPLAITTLIGVHFWQIRKDGGMSRPSQITEAMLQGTPRDERAEMAFPKTGKTYGLMCLVKGDKPAKPQGPERTVPSWPHLFNAEMAIFAVVLAAMILLALVSDAPLKEAANPSVPENPAKAPWYFLGLQELVSYSAFMGGVAIPALAVFGLMLIPFLDRRPGESGTWFPDSGELNVFKRSAMFSGLTCILMLVFTVNFGWLRTWIPSIPQLFIIFINPGTVITALFVWWSQKVLKQSGSTRLSAVALFTCFLISFTILTYFATVHRGPNWGFYWWPSLWPVH